MGINVGVSGAEAGFQNALLNQVLTERPVKANKAQTVRTMFVANNKAKTTCTQNDRNILYFIKRV